MSPRNTEDAFWAKVRKGDGCWEWQGRKGGGGYGHFDWHGRTVLAHRFSYALAYGDVPARLDVMHSCDNPACVNPAHLRVGTERDNMQDMLAKGRGNRAKGEQNGLAKLTWPAVRDIRARYAAGGVSTTALAREYGVHQTLISLVVNRRIWKEEP